MLRGAGVKVTPQRAEILCAVLASDDHPDAEHVFDLVRERLPSVALDTVYRTLWLLTDVGLITTLGVPRERLRFDSNPLPHHHFVCTRCGQTGDFVFEAFDHLTAPDEVNRLGVVAKVQVEFQGLCHDCANQVAAPSACPEADGRPAAAVEQGEQG
ncbi:MAG: transcriptional repressor [Armatimonadetes bacterium]|nr:transcriptional repressor [Armatimonadota bacterium]